MLDHVIIGTYLVLLLFVGLYNRSGAQSIRNYGKIDIKIQNNTFFLLATIFTNSVGGGTVFGLSERVYSQNLAYVYAIALTIIIDILVAIFLVPRLAKHYGVISMGEIIGKHYGKLGRVMMGMAATLVSFGYIAVQISVSSRILQYVLHINYVEGVILSYIIVVTYTAIGGLRSVIFTNFAQFLAIVV
jgi:Na+/proline symporter